MTTEAVAIGIAISIGLMWWLDRSIAAVYPRWRNSTSWRLLRDDFAGWRRQPLDERIGIIALILVCSLYALAIIVATLS